METASSTPDTNNSSNSLSSGIESAEVNVAQTSKTRATRTRASKQKRSSQPKRKQPRRGAKKESDVPDKSDHKEELNVIDENAKTDCNQEKKAVPKRTTRSLRKQSEKDNLKSETPISACVLLGSTNGPSPKHSTRSKRKVVKKPNECQQVLPESKRAKLSPLKMPNTPQNAEIIVPKTPQNEQRDLPVNKDVKNVRSSIKMVLSPVVASNEEQEICAHTVAEKEPANKVFVVDAVSYEEQKGNENEVQDYIETELNNTDSCTPEKRRNEEPTGDATVSSTKKLRGENRASMSGNKRKKERSNNKDKKTRISSPLENKLNNSHSTSSDEAAVSSTTNITSSKAQRKSFRRSSRATRRSSSQRHGKADRKSTLRNSRSLIKSSVMLKLSAKKLMPSIRKEEVLTENDTSLQVNLLEKFESSTHIDNKGHPDENNDQESTDVLEDLQSGESENQAITFSDEQANGNSYSTNNVFVSDVQDGKTAEEGQQPVESEDHIKEKSFVSEEEDHTGHASEQLQSPLKEVTESQYEMVEEPLVSCEKNDNEDLNNTQSTSQDEQDKQEEEIFHDTKETSQTEDEDDENFHDAPDTVATETIG